MLRIIAFIVLLWANIMFLGRVVLSYVRHDRPWKGVWAKVDGLRKVIHAVYRFAFKVTEPVLKLVRLIPGMVQIIPTEKTDVRTWAHGLRNRKERAPRRGVPLDLAPLVALFACFVIAPALLAAA